MNAKTAVGQRGLAAAALAGDGRNRTGLFRDRQAEVLQRDQFVAAVEQAAAIHSWWRCGFPGVALSMRSAARISRQRMQATQ